MLDRPARIPTEQNPFMPDFDSDDYRPPEFRLVQAMSKAHGEQGAEIGTFYCESTGEEAKDLAFSILKVIRTRTLWGENLTAPACSSDNRITPRPGGLHPGPCGPCPAKNNGCYEGYDLLCARLAYEDRGPVLRDEPDLFLLRVSGMSVFPFKRLWTTLKTRFANQPYRVSILLESEKKTNDKGTFYVMAPMETALDEVTAEQVRLLAMATLNLSLNPVEEPDSYSEGVASTRPAVSNRGDPRDEASANPHGATFKRGATDRVSKPPLPHLRLVTRDEALEISPICRELGVPPETVSAYIQHTYAKKRAMELNTGELTLLKAWLYQEYGAPPPVEELPLEEEAVDDLPF